MNSRKSLIRIESLNKRFIDTNNFTGPVVTKALNNVSLNIYDGEILGLIGESGSGKSTLAKCLVNLEKVDSGSIYFDDLELTRLSASKWRDYAHKLQMIFQHPALALNPAHTIGVTLAEPLQVILKIPKAQIKQKVYELLDSVGLDKSTITRFPRQLSGGQKQRVAVARALSINPKVLIADEPTSSLDADLKNQILKLITDLKKKLGLTVLLISHDIISVESNADRIAVMYKGSLLETGKTQDVINVPLHPYTKELIAASYLNYDKIAHSDISHKTKTFSPGCPYHDRCPLKQTVCEEKIPSMEVYVNNHSVACHFAKQFDEDQQEEMTTQSEAIL